MPFVEVHWFEGRSDEQKAEIAKRIEAALIEVAGVVPEHCWVKFSDSAKTRLHHRRAVEAAERRRLPVCDGRAEVRFTHSGRSSSSLVSLRSAPALRRG